jgi:hypothetical protein
METLYIIGNGFDLHHKLPTSYNDFHKHITSHHSDLANIFEDYFNFRTDKNLLWTDFEQDLATFDYNSFFSNHCNIDIGDESFKPSLTYGLEDDIEEESNDFVADIRMAFEDWIDNIDISVVGAKMDLDKKAMFINFNYTMTIEEIYQIPQKQVVHIHGDIQNSHGDLILGHNKEMEAVSELDENGDSNRTLFSDSEEAAKIPFFQFIKPVKDLIEQNIQTFDASGNVANIYVLGHSLNQIDLPYFEEIVKRSPRAIWHVSYHYTFEKDQHALALDKLGIPHISIRFFQL